MSGDNLLKALPKTRVELHAHLDGSIRAETIWELSTTKKLPLPGNGSFRDLQKTLIVREPIDLAHFLAPFGTIIPCVSNDLESFERIAFEFIEDKARDSVAYVEARFAPHGLFSDTERDMPRMEAGIKKIAEGLARGKETYGVDSRIILCTLIGMDTSEEVLKLCEMTRNDGVVAIDTAGTSSDTNKNDEVPIGGMEEKVFQRAKAIGLHRTVHAGERGPAEMVRRAVENYSAERIGHGYHVVEDKVIYQDCRDKHIHFECCPWSSFLTGAVPMGIELHPIAQFAQDKVNFSVNTDDPTITGYELSDDYKLFQSWNLTEAQAVRAGINGAKSAFLPQDERDKLVKSITSYYVYE